MKDKKMIFVYIGAFLILVTLGLVYLDKIDIDKWLVISGGIILLVSNLWLFYEGKKKDEIIKMQTQDKHQLSRQVIKLHADNAKLQQEVSVLEVTR